MRGRIVTLLLLTAGSALAQTQVGSWLYLKRVDPLTDANTSIALTDGLEDEDTSLILKCMNDGLNVYFDPDDYLGDESGEMYWRFDKNTLFGPFEYDPATEGDVAFIPINLITKFIANAKVGRQVVLRAYDFNGTAHTATFNLNGISEVIKRLSCK